MSQNELNDTRILVVEDDKANQRVTKTSLELIGFDVDLAVDGNQAIELVKVNKYNLIFMDCHMPEKNGYDATIEIRSIFPDITIIALTADVTEENYNKCLSLGMKDFIKKPVHIEELRDKAMKWLKRND